VAGDEFSTTLFYEEAAPSKTPADRERIDAAVDRLARSWWLHRYPWPVRSPQRTPCSGTIGYGADISGTLRRRGENPRAILRQEAYSPATIWSRSDKRSGARSGDLRILVTEKRNRYREPTKVAEALPS